MIHIKEDELIIVREILQKTIPHAHVIAFGSRITGNLKPFSDLDLAIDAHKPLSLEMLSKIKDAFSESNLPFRVDIVDMNAVSKEFLKVIKKQYELVQQGNMENKKRNMMLMPIGFMFGILIFGTLSLILPESAYTRVNLSRSNEYLLVYKNTVLWSYGDSIIESRIQEENGETLILKYKEPGEKGKNYRNALILSETSAIINTAEYTRASPWIVFLPNIYEDSFDYFLAITTIRQNSYE